MPRQPPIGAMDSMKTHRLVVGLACLAVGPALAQTHTGVITQVRIDTVANIGVCVATAPELRGVTWACLYSNRPLYQEMRDLLLRAYERGARCTFEWTQVDSMTSRARIDAVTCSSP